MDSGGLQGAERFGARDAGQKRVHPVCHKTLRGSDAGTLHGVSGFGVVHGVPGAEGVVVGQHPVGAAEASVHRALGRWPSGGDGDSHGSPLLVQVRCS